MKAKKAQGIKNLKKSFYRGRTAKFKRVIAVMVIVGLAASLCYLFRYFYIGYASARADIVLTYPEIAQSQKPDGSRFTYYEFLSDEMLEAALEKMQQDGKYANYTVDSLRNSFDLYSYLENSATDSVSTSRIAGNDFSYVANEYRIIYTQPHDYGNSNIFKKVFSGDDSVAFLNALVEANRENIAEITGGSGGFADLVSIQHTENYDYSEKLEVYKTKIEAITDFLDVLHGTSPHFATADGLTLKDIQGKYNFLISDKLNGISNFIESSGITRDAVQTRNKLNVNIENSTLEYNKYVDQSQINKFAMDNYDQTFTENLINVIQSQQYGLYQARPKTAFDTVVAQKHTADERIAECNADIQEYNRELAIYTAPQQTAAPEQPAEGQPEEGQPAEEQPPAPAPAADPEERERLAAKCEELIDGFESEYQALSATATEAVKDYYNSLNRSYLTAKVTHNRLFSLNLLVTVGFVFIIGAILAFIAAIFFDTVSDMRKLKKKKAKLRAIKEASQERGE